MIIHQHGIGKILMPVIFNGGLIIPICGLILTELPAMILIAYLLPKKHISIIFQLTSLLQIILMREDIRQSWLWVDLHLLKIYSSLLQVNTEMFHRLPGIVSETEEHG